MKKTILFVIACISILLPIPANASDEIAIQTILGEARGESLNGQIAVGEVIRNRANNPSWWGNDIDSVCLKKFQFSFWNDKKRAKKILSKITSAEYHRATRAWYESEYTYLTQGSTHYLHYKYYPNWRDTLKPVCRIGKHIFYKEVT